MAGGVAPVVHEELPVVVGRRRDGHRLHERRPRHRVESSRRRRHHAQVLALALVAEGLHAKLESPLGCKETGPSAAARRLLLDFGQSLTKYSSLS